MKQALHPRTRSVRLVEAEGFRSGANGVAPETALAEIDAAFVRQEAEVREEVASRLRQLEARATTLDQMSEQAEAQRAALGERHGANQPRFGIPALITALSFFALAAEAVLLAPILDILGIADPQAQLCAAAAIVTIAALVFHHYLERRREEKKDWLAIVLAIGTVVGLAILGTMRARQLAFAANLTGNPLGEFLNDHTYLGAALFLFFTLFFPIAAAVGLEKGLEGLSAWWACRRAKTASTKLSAAANQARKTLEGETEQIEQKVAQLKANAGEWKSAYQTYHDLGQEVGANRPPRWTVWVKAAVCGIVTFVLLTLLALSAFPQKSVLGFAGSFLVALATSMIAAVWLYHRWEHPSATQYLRQANLRFRDTGMRAAAYPLPERPGPGEVANILAMPSTAVTTAREVNS